MMDTSSNKIIFDLDGTLIDISQRDWWVYCSVLFEQGINDHLDFEPYWRLRRSRTPLIEIIPSTINVKDYVTARQLLIENTAFLELDCPFKHTLTTLESLIHRYELWIVTARRNSVELLKQLEKLKLNQFFQNRVIWTQNKLDVFKEFSGIATVVGDTEYDILPAKAISVKTIAMSTGIRDTEYLYSLKPDWVFDDIERLSEVLLTDASSSDS
jgi:phosphoglycolate phosphatase-like HAD superfamily hydrolase